jgi:hypothetical protein
VYHLLQLAALSPATSRIAERHGSKTNRMRTSLRPREPGRSSFRLAIFELVMCRRAVGPVRVLSGLACRWHHRPSRQSSGRSPRVPLAKWRPRRSDRCPTRPPPNYSKSYSPVVLCVGRCLGAYLSMYWNTHSRFPRLAGVCRGLFSIVLIGNHIADYELVVRLAFGVFSSPRSPASGWLWAAAPGRDHLTGLAA